MENIINEENIIRKNLFQSLPKWLRIILIPIGILIILSIITVIYWAILLIYKILKINRIIMEYVFKEDHYWTFVICLIMILISALLLSQFVFGLDPFGKFINSIIEKINEIKNNLIK